MSPSNSQADADSQRVFLAEAVGADGLSVWVRAGVELEKIDIDEKSLRIWHQFLDLINLDRLPGEPYRPPISVRM